MNLYLSIGILIVVILFAASVISDNQSAIGKRLDKIIENQEKILSGQGCKKCES